MLSDIPVLPYDSPPRGAYLVVSPHMPNDGSFRLTNTRIVHGWKNDVLESMRMDKTTSHVFLTVVDKMALNFPRPDFNMCVFKDTSGVTRGAAVYGPLDKHPYSTHPLFHQELCRLPEEWRQMSIIH